MRTNLDNMKQAVFEVFGVGTAVPLTVEETPAEALATTASPVPAAESAPAAPAAPAVEAVPVMAAPYTLSPVSFLAEGAQWEGTLRSEGDVEVSCPFHGELHAKGAVTLHAAMEGNVTAGNLTLAGCTLTGDVVCEGMLVISRDSRVCGNITTRELRCAGTVTGDITAEDTVVLESTARISGSSATATLAVDKGAVICGDLTIKE